MTLHALLDRPPGSTLLYVSRAKLDEQTNQMHDGAFADIPAETVYAAAVISGNAPRVYSASKGMAHMDMRLRRNGPLARPAQTWPPSGPTTCTA